MKLQCQPSTQFKKHDEINDDNEPLPYGTAIWGLILSGVIASLMLKMAGASFLMVFLNIMAFVVIVACVDTWLVTRGFFFIHGSFKIPDFFISILGTQRLEPATLTIIAFPKRIFFRDRREFPMPHMMNALKISDAGNLNRKHLAGAMAGAIFVGTIVACYSNLRLLYSIGGLNLSGSEWIQISSPQEPFWELSQFLQSPSSTDWQQVVFIIVGAVFTVFLTFMRRVFLWWPLHPIGFVTPGQFPMNTGLWFSIFIGWLIKYIVMRYGGLRMYRVARPIFLGIILGEGIVLIPWALVGFITGGGYNFFTV